LTLARKGASLRQSQTATDEGTVQPAWRRDGGTWKRLVNVPARSRLTLEPLQTLRSHILDRPANRGRSLADLITMGSFKPCRERGNTARKSEKLLRLVRETGSVRWFHRPGEARLSGRPGSGWRCFELRVHIWTSGIGKRRTLASPGDAASGSVTGLRAARGPPRHRSRAR